MTDADCLTDQLGHAIVQAPVYRSYDWTYITLVINLDGGRSQFGYVYWGDDEWEAAGPGFTTLGIAAELRDAMRAAGQGAWKKCLVQITRGSSRVDVAFDHVGDRWTPDMSDPARFARSIRSE